MNRVAVECITRHKPTESYSPPQLHKAVQHLSHHCFGVVVILTLYSFGPL